MEGKHDAMTTSEVEDKQNDDESGEQKENIEEDMITPLKVHFRVIVNVIFKTQHIYENNKSFQYKTIVEYLFASPRRKTKRRALKKRLP